MQKFKIDLSSIPSDKMQLVKDLAPFLKKETNAEFETSEKEITIIGEEGLNLNHIRKLLNNYLKSLNVKGKVKKKGKQFIISISRGKPIFCDKNGNWKRELEERLPKGEEILMFALGKVKYDVLAYLTKKRDIEIVKLETRYMKKREKGMGLKAIVRKSQQISATHP